MEFPGQVSSSGTNPFLRPPTMHNPRKTKINKQQSDTISYGAKSKLGNKSRQAILLASPNAKYLQDSDGDLSSLNDKSLRTLQNRIAQRAHLDRKKQQRIAEESDASFESTSSPQVSKTQLKLPKFESKSPALSESKLSDSRIASPSFTFDESAFHQNVLPQDPEQLLGAHIASLEAVNEQQQQTILKQQQILQHLRVQVNEQYVFSHAIPHAPYAQSMQQIQLPPIDAYQALPNQWQSTHTMTLHDEHELPQLPEEPEWMTEEMSRLLDEPL